MFLNKINSLIGPSRKAESCCSAQNPLRRATPSAFRHPKCDAAVEKRAAPYHLRPLSLRMSAMSGFAFESNTAFLKAPAAAEQPYVVAGIAWDGATTNRPGARFGPRAIRTASHMLCDGTHPHFNVSPLGALGDAGDLALPNTSLAAMRAAMPPLIAPLLARRRSLDHAAPAAGLQGAPGAAARRAALRRPLRHLEGPLRRGERPRHLGL
jgi:hypothetical protein